MAISVVGTPVVGGNGSGSNVTLTLPGPPIEDDFVVLWGGGDDGANTPDARPITSGYDELTPVYSSDDDGNPTGGAWGKWMGPTPDTQVVGGGSPGTIQGWNYGAFVLRGLDPAALDALTIQVVGAPNALATPGQIVTITAGALVMVLVVQASSSSVPTAEPSGYSNLTVRGQSDIWPGAIAGATKILGAETTEVPGNFTSWAGGTKNQVAFTLAFRAAGAATKPFAPDLSLTGLSGAVRYNTGAFQPHPSDPTDTHQSTKYQLSSSPTFGTLEVDVDLGSPNLTEYEAPSIAPGTWYGRAAHVGENFDGDWSSTEVQVVEVTAAPAGSTPSLSLASKAHDYIEVEASIFTHPDGAVEPSAYDEDDPHPYLVSSTIQARLASDSNWNTPLETIEVTYNGLAESRRARFSLSPGTPYKFRGLQTDNFGASTSYSLDLSESTESTPADAPLQPTASVSCGRDVVVTGGTYAHSAVGAGTAHAKSEFGVSYDGGPYVYLIVNSPVTTNTWPDLQPGTASFKHRYGDDSTTTRWGPYSDVDTCEIAAYPSFVKFTSPTTLKVSTNQTIAWVFIDDSVDWLSNIERAVGSGDFVPVASDQVGQTTPFNITGLTDNVYWYRVQAVNPDTGELGEWAYIPITLSRAGSPVRVFHRNAAQLAVGGGGGRQAWAGPGDISWQGKTEGGIGKGLFATRVHGGLDTHHSLWLFDAGGQVDSGDVIVGLSHRPDECEWPPHRFSNPQVTKGGPVVLADGTTVGVRHGRATLLEVPHQPWYLHSTMPCATDLYKAKAAATTAWWSAKNPSKSWRYGRANAPGKLRTVTHRNGASNPSHSSGTLGSSTEDRIGGPYLSIGGDDHQAYIQTEVRRSGSGWNIRSRFLGAGAADDWTSPAFVAEESSGDTIPCGVCGFAYSDMDQFGVGRSLGILYTSITIRALSFGTCEELEEECASGMTLNRILSIERHPDHAVIEYFTIGGVPCPEVEA